MWTYHADPVKIALFTGLGISGNQDSVRLLFIRFHHAGQFYYSTSRKIRTYNHHNIHVFNEFSSKYEYIYL